MKRLWTVLMVGLLVAAVTAPALAWEFSMNGEYEFRFRWFSRTGNNDLFGNAALQNSGVGGLPMNLTIPTAALPQVPGGVPGVFGATVSESVGFAGPNIYGRGARFVNTGVNVVGVPVNNSVVQDNAAAAGVNITRGGFSRWGSDGFYRDSRWTLRPVVRVNKCIRVHGVYTVGGYRNKYVQQSYWNAFDTTPGGFDLVGNRTAVPSAGIPPFERYYMQQESVAAYNTAAIGSWEQFRATITIPWGIFSIGVKDFPFGTGATLAYNTRAEAFLTVVPYGPFRLLHGIWMARGATESWGVNPDGDDRNDFFQGALYTYRVGPLEQGAGVIRLIRHNTAGNAGINSDLAEMQWIAYFKYNNGRFFANGEYFWVDSDTYRLGAAQTYAELYHLFAETGVVAGPMRLSLMWAQASGRVLNNGNPTKLYADFNINYQALEPYNFLMFYTYGGGNQRFNADGHGEMSDAYAFAGRVDYAAASNLNCWASYIWAHRLEQNGYFFGHYNSVGLVSSAADRITFAANAGRALPPIGNPYVTDGYLGFEVDAGVNWKLLEGMTATFKYAYWQPGDWFKEAYQAVSINPGGGITAQGVLQTRDAIQAFEGTLMIEF